MKSKKGKWKKIQNNNSKTCLNCSKLHKDNKGQYICNFRIDSESCRKNGVVIFDPNRRRPLCFDKYNNIE